MSVEAIVLAGGRSSRFGSDKLAAGLDGGTVLHATIDAVTSIADAVIVAGSAVPSGLRAGETPVRSLPDREPFGGPLVALAGALEREDAGPSDLAIVVGGDMPRVVPAVLAAMLDVLRGTPAVEAVVLGQPGAPTVTAPSEPPRRQVLPLALRRQPASRVAREAVEAGHRSLQALVDRLTAVELPADAWLAIDPTGRTLTDVDTPADLDRLNVT